MGYEATMYLLERGVRLTGIDYTYSVNAMRPHCVGISTSEHAFLNRSTFPIVARLKRPLTRLSQQRVKGCIDGRDRAATQLMPLPDWSSQRWSGIRSNI
jgi:hypothetical protein